MNIIIWIIVGAISGWLAGQVVRGYDFGLVRNILVGLVGAVIGGWIFGQLGIVPPGGLLGTIAVSFSGAVTLLILARILVQVFK